MLERGERRLTRIFDLLPGAEEFCRVHDVDELGGYPKAAVLERWFMNVNTPEDLAEAERYVDVMDT